MVVFHRGAPDKSAYRRYRIRGQDTPDDPAMIHEAVSRRVQH
jgi:excinuclease UvrABC nuclease subunit